MLKKLAINKKAKYDYEFIYEETAGIVLLGTEVKPIRNGKANLKDSYCYFKNGELYCNFHISETNLPDHQNHDPLRAKKLLLTKQQLKKMQKQVTEKGVTIIPYSIISNEKSIIKLIIKVAKGKKQFEKKDKILQKDIDRNLKIDLDGR